MSTEPLSVSDALGNAGPLPEVKWSGKTWKVGHPCPEAVAHAERLAARLAWDTVNDLRDVYDPKEFAELKASTTRDIQGKAWQFGGSLFNAMLSGPDGNAAVLYACLKLNHPTLGIEDVRRMTQESRDDVELALLQVSPSFFSEAAERLSMPPDERKAAGVEMGLQAVSGLLKAKAARTDSATSPKS